MKNNDLRIFILNLLKENHLQIRGIEKYYLMDFSMNVIDFKNLRRDEEIYMDDNFEIVLTNNGCQLKTSYSNQVINENWINKLNKLNQVVADINDQFNKLINE